jgi:hypothetical protein
MAVRAGVVVALWCTMGAAAWQPRMVTSGAGATEPSATAVPTLVMRGQAAVPMGEVIGFSSIGVVMGTRLAPNAKPLPSTIVGWDRVKSLTLPEGWAGSGEGEMPLATHLALGERVWRARRRLERGDAPAAEPLFESAFAEYRRKPGPTSAVIAEGLLRCRLRRGAHVLALEPWLSWMAAEQRDPAGASHYQANWADLAGLAPVQDSATGLVPALPPIWLGWETVRNLAHAEGGVGVSEGWALDTPPGALQALYRAAAMYEVGREVEMPKPLPEHPGVGLVAIMVKARVGTEEQRAMGRRQLEDRLRSATSPWLEAWCRTALGRSLVQEGQMELRRRGVLELLEVPARFSKPHPYLAGVALAEASVVLAGMNEAEASKVLRQELAREYPTHPALEWGPVREALARDGALIKSEGVVNDAAGGGVGGSPTPSSALSEPPR